MGHNDLSLMVVVIKGISSVVNGKWSECATFQAWVKNDRVLSFKNNISSIKYSYSTLNFTSYTSNFIALIVTMGYHFLG